MILFQQGRKFWMYSENMAVHNIIVSDVSRGVWAMFIDLHAMNTVLCSCSVYIMCSVLRLLWTHTVQEKWELSENPGLKTSLTLN